VAALLSVRRNQSSTTYFSPCVENLATVDHGKMSVAELHVGRICATSPPAPDAPISAQHSGAHGAGQGREALTERREALRRAVRSRRILGRSVGFRQLSVIRRV
jgi:hypothetical protein